MSKLSIYLPASFGSLVARDLVEALWSCVAGCAESGAASFEPVHVEIGDRDPRDRPWRSVPTVRIEAVLPPGCGPDSELAVEILRCARLHLRTLDTPERSAIVALAIRR